MTEEAPRRKPLSKRWKQGIAILIGLVITLATFAVPIVVADTAPPVPKGYALFPAGVSQQTVNILDYGDSGIITTTTPTSLRLEATYQDFNDSKLKLTLSIAGSVAEGDNATFSVSPSFDVNDTIQNDYVLDIMIVNPSGFIVATYPQGESLQQSPNYAQSTSFSSEENIYGPSSDWQQINSAFVNGKVWFTYPIVSQPYAGTWQVFVFYASNINEMASPKTIAAGALSFEVAPPPANLSGLSYLFLEGVEGLSTFAAIGALSYIALNSSPLPWVKRNGVVVLLVVSLAVLFVVRFIVL